MNVKTTRGPLIAVAISLLLILCGCMLSYAVDTDWGQVKIERVKLVDQEGYTLTGILRIPKSAYTTPAPTMIVVPGGDCTADIASPWANEITRRGYVTFAVDYSGMGDTQLNPKSQYFTNNGSMGLDTVYDYLLSRQFVDAEQIGICGHSMGSLYSYRLALQRPVSLVVSDVVFQDAAPQYNFNFAQITAEHDEGILARIDSYQDIFKDPMLTMLFGTESIEPEVLYGSWENRTARIFYSVNQTHQDDMISGAFISKLNSVVMQAMPAPTPIEAGDMIYGWKIVGLAIALTGMLTFLFGFGAALLKTALFSGLCLAPSASIGFGMFSRSWWLYSLGLTLVPVLTFFPGTAIGNKMGSTPLLQLGATPNGYLTWSLLSAVAMGAMLLVCHYVIWKKKQANARSYGLATVNEGNAVGVGYLLRALLFSVTVLAAAYGLLLLIFQYAKTDLHLIVLSLRPLSAERFATYPWYCLALLPYLFTVMVAGCGTNSADKSGKEAPLWKTVLVGTLSGLVGLLVLYIAFEVVLRFTSVGPFYTKNFANFYLSLLAVVIPEFAVATALGIYFSKKTNSKWIGVFLGAMLVAFFMVSSNGLAYFAA